MSELKPSTELDPKLSQWLEKHRVTPEDADAAPENLTSGQGAQAIVPPEARNWNWGAFGLGWIWGIANRVWISFLLFIAMPIQWYGHIMLMAGNKPASRTCTLLAYAFMIAFSFVLGYRGSEWAWRKRHFPGGLPQFRAVQHAWMRIAVIIIIATVLGGIVLMLTGPLLYR
jgi:hypothetical protein